MPEHDPVNHPKHYMSHTGIECIDAIEAAMGPAGAAAFCRGNAMKYLWRADQKNVSPVEDLQKAQWYLARELDIRKRNNL